VRFFGKKLDQGAGWPGTRGKKVLDLNARKMQKKVEMEGTD